MKFGRSGVKPVVTLPLSQHFNDTISMDLHNLTKCGPSVFYLNIVDLFTRFSQAAIIYEKKPDTIINELNRKWTFVFGALRRILSDNGGEFDADKFRSNAENLNKEVIGTPAESPWANGVVERHNEVLTENFLKTRTDSGRSFMHGASCFRQKLPEQFFRFQSVSTSLW